jgi:hypothetical protein
VAIVRLGWAGPEAKLLQSCSAWHYQSVLQCLALSISPTVPGIINQQSVQQASHPKLGGGGSAALVLVRTWYSLPPAATSSAVAVAGSLMRTNLATTCAEV